MRPLLLGLLFPSALALFGCANSDPIGGTGGEGGGPWVTHGPGGTTSGGKGATTGAGNGPAGNGPSGNGPSGTGPSATTGTGSPGPGCGDGMCDANEDCQSCPNDCGACGPMCGDAQCNGGETCQSCPGDCGACAVCGNGVCDATETCSSCYQDCGVCACMPDGFEPDNGSASAKAVASGSDYCMLSVCAGDVDWLKFTVAHGFTAQITFQNGQGDLDLEIYSAQTLAYITGSYTNADTEAVTLSGLSAGTYWARVYGYQGATNPAYCFHVDTN